MLLFKISTSTWVSFFTEPKNKEELLDFTSIESNSELINSCSLNKMIPILVFDWPERIIKVWGTGSELFPSRRSSSSAHWVPQKVKICTEAGSAYYQLEAELELLYFYSAGFTAGFLIGGVQDIQPHLVRFRLSHARNGQGRDSLYRIVCLLLWDCLDHILRLQCWMCLSFVLMVNLELMFPMWRARRGSDSDKTQ